MDALPAIDIVAYTREDYCLFDLATLYQLCEFANFKDESRKHLSNQSFACCHKQTVARY